MPPLRGGLGGGKGGIAPPPRILPPLPPAGEWQLAADAMWPKNLVTACQINVVTQSSLISYYTLRLPHLRIFSYCAKMFLPPPPGLFLGGRRNIIRGIRNFVGASRKICPPRHLSKPPLPLQPIVKLPKKL